MTTPMSPKLSLDEIAERLQGYDPQALSAQLVNDFLAQLVQPVREHEIVPLMQAHGRILAQDVVSPISVPAHDNSAMDGYALRGSDLLANEPTTLKSVGTAFAGAAWQGHVQSGECVRIMTGAIMPAGLDTVAPQELVQVNGETLQIPPGLLKTGDNRRLLGEDLMAGQPALQGGTRLSPAACGLLASLGLPTVPVWRRPKVAYFSTGDEILSLGEAPREGAVYDSNRYTVAGMVQALGCELIDMGVVRDEPAALEQAFKEAAAQADAIITSGGVSVGEADYTKAMMKKLGDVAFWRIAMRPGRPMAVGRIRQGDRSAVLFGLPGNPVAVMVTFAAFVRPALQQLMGWRAPALPMLKAKSTEALRKKPGRTEYQRGIVSTNALGELQVSITGNQGSGVLSSMVQANGLIVLGHAQGNVAVGDAVDVMMFDGHL
ncbi:molybdopterin molybdenumtransferase MoeA [Limnohabitans sp. 2KL-17]|uniref:molybdopterin molybdotransferase MoeA n=1 Tax=Limnohabitans sp. 2KL-17 TaxID=1100704 RepID=UPI000D386ED9|nr:gephyrin-like molybdotransferase Glp [Limnohabitans sp. 2KL-17]PUE56851.1 molybdopterin molybdenumtransferase MoeA [Limnohabitans sp. 2KL-17]